MSAPRPSPAPWGALLLAPLVCAATACQALEAHTYNLRELHDEDGDHLRSAALLSDAEYIVRYGIVSLFRRGEVATDAKKKLDDPLETCIENLLELGAIPAGSEGFEALKVEHFARYARIDEWQLSRQVCFDQLGFAGARLDLGAHPAPPASTAPVATAEDLRAALEPLVKTSDPRRGIPEKVEVAEPCRAIAALHYDDEGILRALATSAALLNRQPLDSPHHAMLLALVLDLERRTVHGALARGLDDPSPAARAACVSAGVRAIGPEFLARVLPRLGTEVEPAMPLAILRAVREEGLPPDKPGVDPAQNVREGALALFYRVATEHPEDSVRVAAMRALGAVAKSGFRSVREEDWQAWWRARKAPGAP